MAIEREEGALRPAQFIESADIILPKGARCWFMTSFDGAEIRVSAFPKEGAAATIMLVTGWAEYTEKYVEVVEDLHRRGFHVAMMDWRGQGLSDRMGTGPHHGYVDSFDTHLKDFRLFAENFVPGQFSGPLLLMGHSMGGCLSLLALGEGWPAVKGAVLSAPMTRLFAGSAKRKVVRFLSLAGSAAGASRKFVPGVRQHSLQFEGNNLTSDPRRHARFRQLQDARPEAALRGPTFGWLHAAHEGMHRLNKPGALDDLKVPVLMVLAGNDQTVDTANAARLAGTHRLVRHVVIEGSYHELLMERDIFRDQFWNHADRFLEELGQ